MCGISMVRRNIFDRSSDWFGWRRFRVAIRRFAHCRGPLCAGSSVRRGGEDWRSDGLVFHQLALGSAGIDGSGNRWHRDASRAATS